eukprot:6011713-Amphidinium_carterae.1
MGCEDEILLPAQDQEEGASSLQSTLNLISKSATEQVAELEELCGPKLESNKDLEHEVGVSSQLTGGTTTP